MKEVWFLRMIAIGQINVENVVEIVIRRIKIVKTIV